MSKKIHAASCIAGSALRSLAVGCALGASLTCVVAAGPQDQLAQSSSSTPAAAQGQGQPHRDAAPHDTRDLRENRDNRDDARSRHPSHMTPGERRDLRRQINEAGQDIYANSPHH